MIHKKIILKSIQSIYNVEKEIFKDYDDYDSSCIFNEDQLILFFLQYTNNRFISFLIIWMATTSINQKKKRKRYLNLWKDEQHTFSLFLSRITITQ